MLSRAQIDDELKAFIKIFNSNWIETDGSSSTDSYLDELILAMQVYSAPGRTAEVKVALEAKAEPLSTPANQNDQPSEIQLASIPDAPAETKVEVSSPRFIDKSTEDKIEVLRNHLRNVLASESRRAVIKEFYDHVFDLQITLAHAFPVNQCGNESITDPITLEDIEYKDLDPVMFSNGQVVPRAGVQAFYSTHGCYDKNQKLKDLNVSLISQREIESLKRQHITIIPPSSFIERFVGADYRIIVSYGTAIGALVGLIVSITALLIFMMACPLMPIIDLFSIAVGILSYLNRGSGRPIHAFLAGAYAVYVFVGIASLAFPPLLGLLASMSIINSAGVVAATNLFQSIIIPYVVPAVMLAVGIITSYVKQIPLARAFGKILSNVFATPIYVCAYIGDGIDKAIRKIRDLLHSPAHPAQPDAPNDAASVIATVSISSPRSSNALMSSMGVNATGSHDPQIDHELVVSSDSSAVASSTPAPAPSEELDDEIVRGSYRPS
jgi:hypothetical protein